MIFKESYNYLLKSASSKEFDICLYSILRSDWDGIIQAPIDEIAKNAQTTKKYVREVFKKFVSPSKGRFVLSPVKNSEGNQYRLNIGKSTVDFDPKTDTYSKKYKFFYTPEFRNLPINAKRLILMGAFRMSVSKEESVSIDINEVVPSTHNDATLPFTKGRLVEAISSINSSNLGVVNVSLSTNVFTRKEEVSISFKKDTLDEYYENNTERFLLRKKLVQAGYKHYLPDEFCTELEKVGKYLFNSLTKQEKSLAREQGAISNAKDELRKLARFIYNTSIDKLANALNSKKDELNEPKKLSAYFSAITHSVATDELAKFAHQFDSINSLLSKDHIHSKASEMLHGTSRGFAQVDKEVSPVREKLSFIGRLRDSLNNWCEDWVISRVNTITQNHEPAKTDETPSTTAERLKTTVLSHLHSTMDNVKLFGNKAVQPNLKAHFLEKSKETLLSYFSIVLKDETEELVY